MFTAIENRTIGFAVISVIFTVIIKVIGVVYKNLLFKGTNIIYGRSSIGPKSSVNFIVV